MQLCSLLSLSFLFAFSSQSGLAWRSDSKQSRDLATDDTSITVGNTTSPTGLDYSNNVEYSETANISVTWTVPYKEFQLALIETDLTGQDKQRASWSNETLSNPYYWNPQQDNVTSYLFTNSSIDLNQRVFFFQLNNVDAQGAGVNGPQQVWSTSFNITALPVVAVTATPGTPTPTAASSSPTASGTIARQASGMGTGEKIGLGVGIGVGVLLIALSALAAFFVLKRRRHVRDQRHAMSQGKMPQPLVGATPPSYPKTSRRPETAVRTKEQQLPRLDTAMASGSAHPPSQISPVSPVSSVRSASSIRRGRSSVATDPEHHPGT